MEGFRGMGSRLMSVLVYQPTVGAPRIFKGDLLEMPRARLVHMLI